MLQAQMAADKRAIESLTEENRQLQTNVEDLRVQARNLQGEVIVHLLILLLTCHNAMYLLPTIDTMSFFWETVLLYVLLL